MMINYTKRILILLIILQLGACSIFSSRPEVDESIIIKGISGENRQFILAGLPSYVDEDEVYRIEPLC